MTTVSDIMTRGVRTMAPSDSVVLAAQAMDELNVGAIPVCDGDKLVGMVTDRDIVVRAVAQECDSKSTRLADVMSKDLRYARESERVEDVLGAMAQAQIRRVPVIDAQQRLVGMLSLGDVADKDAQDQDKVAASLGGISFPAQPDRSGQSRASGAAGGGQTRTK
jgi:CBS domain-containing protein